MTVPSRTLASKQRAQLIGCGSADRNAIQNSNMLEVEPFDALALSLHHSPGVNALLVGSGLSHSAGIPTGWEITLDLIRRLAALKGVTSEVDWSAWFQKEYSKDPNYSEIMDALAATPSERRAILHTYIEPQEGEESRRPTKAHHAIARLVAAGAVRVIITTNFDRLIENALHDVGIEPTVIASKDALAGASPLIQRVARLLSFTGTISTVALRIRMRS